MTQRQGKNAGFVSLIGAGPGDPGLITVKGLQRLQEADAVVYDALVNPRLLANARPDARLFDAGKRGGEHKRTQEQTNQLLLDLARQGLKVARLKGGDPYLFGRGAEEAAFLGRHGIPCEVIPGITSGIAAPAYAGIPVTHRRLASSVTFVTGHEDPAKPEAAVDYQALTHLIEKGGTVCFYMGMGRLPEIVAGLIHQGLSPQTPAAVVQWGTLTCQRSVRSALDQIMSRVKQQGIGSPAIIVVGQVAALDEPGLAFFTSRPLFGLRVLVTRAPQQAAELSLLLEAQGAHVIEAPTIQIMPPPAEDQQAADLAIREVAKHDWLILTSPNAVEVFANRLADLGLDGRHLASVRIAAVGQATATALAARLALKPDFVPRQASGSTLGQEMVGRYKLRGTSVLLFRADLAGQDLSDVFKDAGAEVEEVTAYITSIAEALPEEAIAALRDRRIDWLTFTSSSTARNLVELLGDERGLLTGIRTASIGTTTSQTMRELGLAVTVQAQSSSLSGLVAAMVEEAERPGSDAGG